MPLSPTGKRILSKFRNEYGAKRGTANFYASENAGRITPKAFLKRPTARRAITG